MKCIMGIVQPDVGSIIAEIDGVRHELVGMTTEEIVDLHRAGAGGTAAVPAADQENLLLGAFRPTARVQRQRNDYVQVALARAILDRRGDRRRAGSGPRGAGRGAAGGAGGGGPGPGSGRREP